SCCVSPPYCCACSTSPVRRPPCPTLFPYTTLFRSLPPPPRRRSGRDGFPPARQRTRSAPSPPAGGVRPPAGGLGADRVRCLAGGDRKSTRLNSSHVKISYAVFCLKKKTERIKR